MKVTIDIEINDEILLEAIKKGEGLEDIGAAIQTNVALKIKADFAKIVIDICKAQNIPLGDLISSKA